MDRRSFFKFGLNESKKAVTEAVKVGIEENFRRTVIRPPGALPEDQFLLSCTRCDDCTNSCPHQAIHLVDAISAGLSNRTPFIDPYYKACQYCKDMPCITSCQTGALSTKEGSKELPKMALAKIAREHCLVNQGQRCDYCFNTCPEGINALTRDKNGEPIIDDDICVGCGKCAYICVSQTGKAILMEIV